MDRATIILQSKQTVKELDALIKAKGKPYASWNSIRNARECLVLLVKEAEGK